MGVFWHGIQFGICSLGFLMAGHVVWAPRAHPKGMLEEADQVIPFVSSLISNVGLTLLMSRYLMPPFLLYIHNDLDALGFGFWCAVWYALMNTPHYASGGKYRNNFVLMLIEHGHSCIQVVITAWILWKF